MEIRLVIAYTLIAVLVAVAIFGAIWLSQKKERDRRRRRGNIENMRGDSNTKG